MISPPKRIFFVTIVVALTGVASYVVWHRSENQLRYRAERLLGRKLGADVRIGKLSTTPSGIALHDITVDGVVRGIELQISSMSLSPDLMLLVSQQRLLIDAIDMDGVDVTLRRGRDDDVARSKSTSLRAGEDSLAARPLSRMLARADELLSHDAAVVVENLRVSAVSEKGDGEVVLREARMNIVRDRGKLSVEGKGRSGTGGRLHWEGSLDGSGLPRGRLWFRDLSLGSVAALAGFLKEIPWHRPETARLGGRLDFAFTERSVVSFDGGFTAEGIGLAWPRLSDQPIVTDIAMEVSANWDGNRLWIANSRIQMGRAELEWSGALGRSQEHYFLDVQARLPGTSCGDVMSSIPEALMGRLSGIDWDGTLEGSIALRLDSSDPDATDLQVDVSDRCRFRKVPSVADVDRFRGSFVHHVQGDDGVVFQFETGPGTPNWTPLPRVSPFLIHAVLAHEDATFFEHQGFARFAIELAIERNLREGRFAYGASTISMQLAKNLFLERDRTLARKLQEVILTWWLERKLSKREILELYLNVIEYGSELYGIGTATHYYFGRDPEEMSPAESAFLACLLPAPRAYYRQYRRGRLSEGKLQQVGQLLRHMREKERIDDQALEYGLAELARWELYDGIARRAPRRGSMGSAAPLPLGHDFYLSTRRLRP